MAGQSKAEHIDMNPYFSFSKTLNAAYCLAIFFIGLCMSSITPPMQSPDEPAHIGRAYLLTKGQIMLDAPKEQHSGGYVDNGLLIYAHSIDVFAGKRWSTEEEETTRSIKWEGDETFFQMSGTGFYFPIVYLPQASGLLIGKGLNLSVADSYQLARFLALLCSCLLIFAAFRVHQPPLTVYLLLALPMTLFQMGAASLDGVSNAIAILAISIFLRIAHNPKTAKPWLFFLLSLACFTLASCRAHLLPILSLPFAAWFIERRKAYLIAAIVCTVLTLGWTLLAMKTTVHAVSNGGHLTGFYAQRPLLFLQIVAQTLTDESLSKFYYLSFIGALGWLDTYFEQWTYQLISGLLLLGALVGFTEWRQSRTKWSALLFTALAFVSILLIFFALLTTWTKHPATLIDGVQGRYFFIPVILLAYALTPYPNYADRGIRLLSITLLGFFLALVVTSSLSLLTKRYYQSPEMQPVVKAEMRPSPILSENITIPLRMTHSQTKNMISLSSIEILFGTYARINQGTATLVLSTKDGQRREYPIDLPKLADNQYHAVQLEPMPYTDGYIRYQTGGGISTWEAHRDDGKTYTCLIYGGTNGFKRKTPYCP
jgi:uncharacterized membrane protein